MVVEAVIAPHKHASMVAVRQNRRMIPTPCPLDMKKFARQSLCCTELFGKRAAACQSNRAGCNEPAWPESIKNRSTPPTECRRLKSFAS
jgi:hypothetical protein